MNHSHARALRLLAVLLALALLAAPLAEIARAQDPDTAPHRRGPGDDTLALLNETMIPPRDRIDLARRLLGVTGIPAPPTTPPAELELGAVRTFWVDNLDNDYEFQVDAELIYKTDHIYVFYEVGQRADWDAIKRSTDRFEEVVRPRIHEVFGEEWSPGIDGDPHLVILHARDMGNWVAAYYASSSQYPTEAVPTSNEAEMFFVNLDTMRGTIGTPEYESVLAHEFQHMVHWHIDQNEESWLNEGASELAAMIAGYGASSFAAQYLRNPALQLNTWPEDNNRAAHYGAAFMFMAYFYDRYGEEATTALIRSPLNGLSGVETALDAINATDPSTGAPVALADLFGDWVIANLLLDPSAGDGRYAYTLEPMQHLPRANPTHQLAPSSEPIALSAPQWGANVLALPESAAPRTYRVQFEGDETVSIVPVDAHSGEFMVWSNRADESDTRLTRAFDLTGVSSATLNFWTWYHIEEGWDYAYVTVSTDGERWFPLESARTTTDDPHSNAYGPGYTGLSEGWVEETIDLTPYAGQEIMLRFEYITDDAVTQPGLIVDDVSIPEIGYFEDFESGDGGWQSEGWLRMDNRLPQEFLVQLVRPGATDEPVTRLLGPGETPSGEWTITAGGEAGGAMLVVSGLAPVTTEPARYTLALVAE